jgi:ABC-type uncharacterized transport system substrate-binding protein
MKRIGFWIRLGVFAWLACLLHPAQAYQVWVVSGDKVPAFQEASDSLVQELVRSGIARQDIVLLSAAEFQDSNLSNVDTKLIVSLGSDAFRQVVARTPRAAVMAALIPRISYERVLQESGRKAPSNMAALYLDQPFGRQLDLLRLALPALHHFGVVWGPESVTQQPLLQAAAQARGLDLSEGVVSDSTPLISALRSALANAEVLLAVADSSVYNATTASNILLTSYHAKTAVMAFSPAYVKAGALLSVHSTATQAGMQLAAMASHFLQSNTLPGNQYPSDFTLTGNDYVARSLGISLDVKTLAERLHKLEKLEKKP